jgi:DNA repair exonuclease SbcCD ATPase subunit
MSSLEALIGGPLQSFSFTCKLVYMSDEARAGKEREDDLKAAAAQVKQKRNELKAAGADMKQRKKELKAAGADVKQRKRELKAAAREANQHIARVDVSEEVWQEFKAQTPSISSELGRLVQREVERNRRQKATQKDATPQEVLEGLRTAEQLRTELETITKRLEALRKEHENSA